MQVEKSTAISLFIGLQIEIEKKTCSNKKFIFRYLTVIRCSRIANWQFCLGRWGKSNRTLHKLRGCSCRARETCAKPARHAAIKKCCLLFWAQNRHEAKTGYIQPYAAGGRQPANKPSKTFAEKQQTGQIWQGLANDNLRILWFCYLHKFTVKRGRERWEQPKKRVKSVFKAWWNSMQNLKVNTNKSGK